MTFCGESVNIMCTNLLIEIIYGKENVSAEKEKAGANARIPLAFAKGFRPHHTAHPAAYRAPPPRGIIIVFPRRKRLVRTAFPSLLSSGKRVSSPHFKLIASSKSKGYAIVVPKRVSKRSTDRHNIKRRVAGALQELHVPLPSSFILYPQTTVKNLRYDEMRAELATLLSSL